MEATSLRSGVNVKFSWSLRGRPPADFFLPDISTFAGLVDALVELLDALAGVLDFGVVVADDLEVFFGGGLMRARQADMGAQWVRKVVNVGKKRFVHVRLFLYIYFQLIVNCLLVTPRVG